MIRYILLTAFACIVFVGCKQNHNLSPAPETIFNEPGMHVITSFFNERTQTISVLYGNGPALSHAGRAISEHVAGEEFKLVTWGLKPNPLWFGSNINGPVHSVESVKIAPGNDDALRFDYHIEHAKAPQSKMAGPDERINFIFAQRASVFP